MRPLRPLAPALLLAGALLALPGPEARADIGAAAGQVTLLRVHDVGTGYGPPTDFLDVEVVVQLHTEPGRAFGFQLRDDANRPVRQGMLDLLRDAFNNGWTVNLNYDFDPGDSNGTIFRVWLTK